MHYPGYNSGSVILTEGGNFPFRVHNRVQLQDNAWYYVLQDINGLKHFMPAVYYEAYGFKPGDEIVCKIDRINCTGRIFLEPKHPVYNEGIIYTFDVLGFYENNTEQILNVKDWTGNVIEVKVGGTLKLVKSVNRVQCLVKSIKKGKPVLEIQQDIL
jgi:hypothetical protein